MSFGATASLVMDAIDTARELAEPALEAASATLGHRDVA
jgi:hypothetical protein